MDLGLKGKKALVTGGSKGIGRATAELLASEGADVAICARNADEVSAAVEALKSKGVNAIGSAVDVGDGDAYKKWIESAIGELGGLDILVPNVSAGGGANIGSEDGWKANFEVDIMGTARAVNASLESLTASKGSIVIISTTTALEEGPGSGPYGVVKAALINYANHVSQANGRNGVRCNVVSPGPIYIEGGAWNFIKDNMEDFYNATEKAIPLGYGAAEDVANAVVFLASPAGGHITGTNLVVDGGFTKRVQL